MMVCFFYQFHMMSSVRIVLDVFYGMSIPFFQQVDYYE